MGAEVATDRDGIGISDLHGGKYQNQLDNSDKCENCSLSNIWESRSL